MSQRYIRQEPYIDDYGIFVPENECVAEGCVSTYRCLMTKDMFVEAYNKWIKNDSKSKYDSLFCGKDDADCWSDD